jgi:hypothetical protein
MHLLYKVSAYLSSPFSAQMYLPHGLTFERRCTSKAEMSLTDLLVTRRLKASRMDEQLSLFLETLIRNRESTYRSLDWSVESFFITNIPPYSLSHVPINNVLEHKPLNSFKFKWIRWCNGLQANSRFETLGHYTEPWLPIVEEENVT